MGDLTLKQTLNQLIQSGFYFEVAQDKLLIKGDLAALNDAQKIFLKENKAAIVALIENQTAKALPIRKTEGNTPKLLSYSQQGLWLLDKINNGSHQYNITSAFRLKGKVNYTALNQTFLTILQRHESLRSSFSVNAAGQPVQSVQPIENFEVGIEVLDPAKGDWEDQVLQKYKAEANRVFDLTKDLLLSVQLLKLEADSQVLIINMHHIASDGWSMGVLINEFNILYNSYAMGGVNPLPDLSIQYADYANWQRQWLNGPVLKSYIDYWKNKLANLPLLHNLPLDKARPRVQRFKGSTYSSFVNKETMDSLQQLCQAEQASFFMGVYAVFNALLARYSNETDIVIGSPVANREQAEMANLVGFFMNLIVLRCDLSERPNFKQLLRQSKHILEDAYEYQQMPFDRLVEELKAKRNLSHSPLFQILLSLHNQADTGITLQDLILEPYESAEDQNAKYDLSLDVYQKSDGLQLVWEYNTDLFEQSTIADLAQHFNTLLHTVLQYPEENVFNLDILGENRHKALYEQLKGTSVSLDWDAHVVCGFQKQLATKAKETAVICNDRKYTYQELGSRVDNIAQILLHQGVKERDKVGLCLLRDVELVASIFACFKIGAAYIPLDPVYPADRLSQIIQDAQPKCVLSLEPLKKIALPAETGVNFIYLDTLDTTSNNSETTTKPDFDHTAYIIFTSGTTGKPKGIEISHHNLANLLKGFDRSFETQERQKWLAQTSINFDISVLELIWTISRGHSIVLQPSNPIKLLAPERLQDNGPMDFSIMFFGADKSTDHKYDLLLDTVKYADANKFTAIWTPERHFGEFGGAFPSPSVLSSALSVLTKNLQIRSGSVVLPLHDPIRVAEEWAIIDNLSNGRVGLSIASGWHPDDFVFYQSDYHNRHQILREKVEELKKLWEGIPIVRKNGVGQDFEIKIRPQPKQKELPIWITAAGNPNTFEYAGEIGANILTHLLGQSLDQLTENIRVYHAALEANGHRKEEMKVSLMLHTYITATEQSAFKNSEKAFKEYLESSIKLIEPMAKAEGLDINTQRKEIVEIVYQKFGRENTLIGSPESCQQILQKVQSIGVNEIACLVDFGVENDKVIAGLEKIAETKDLFQANRELLERLEVDKQTTVVDLIQAHKISHVQMTPSQSSLVWNMMRQMNGVNLSSIKHWFIGGEAIPQELIGQLSQISKARFYNMYGPTETTVWSAWREITPADIHIGAPIINTELLLLNEFEQEVPVGVVGELYIGGQGLAKGYYNNAALTAERFKAIDNSPFGKGRYYKTGDLMRLTRAGTFEFVGRADNQVKVNGYRIELEEIEYTINQIPGVRNCKVVPMTDENQTYLSAYVAKEEIVRGDYKALPPEQEAKPFYFPDGSLIYSQSDRQLGLLYHEIMEEGIYFKHGISISEHGLVLDVGANVGGFSIDMSQRYPNATVVAFEPIPQTFSALKKNFEHRQIKGVIYNYGVSNKPENASFYYYREMSGMSGRFANKETIIGAVEQYMKYEKETIQSGGLSMPTLERDTIQAYYENVDAEDGLSDEAKGYLSSLYTAEKVDCQLIPLSAVIDELDIKAIDLLKVDVEKSERLVLEGIRPEQWPMIRQLVVEVDGDDNLQFILQLLKGKGYRVQVDELAMSDATASNEENTYLLYASNEHYGKQFHENGWLKIGAQVNEPVIREALKHKLPDYMSPKHISFVDAIPLMENGKVDLMKLKAIQPQQTIPKREKIAMSNTELDIYRLWCEVLKKENIPYHISIFEAGGSSIEMILLHEKMQKHFKVEFSLIELFRQPTLEQQARLIQSITSRQTEQVDHTGDKAMEKGALRRRARLENKENNQ